MAMRTQLIDIGRCRIGWVSEAESGSAVRSVGGPLDKAPTALKQYHLFESALA
jgi:hypothetical protein